VASVESLPAPAPDLDLDLELTERARSGAAQAPRRRAAVLANLVGAAFVAAAGGFLLLPAHRSFDWATAALLVAALALVSRVRFEVGSVFAMATQLVVAPMALALPARTLPLLVACGYLAGEAKEIARGTLPLGRLPLVFASAWYAVGPAAVLVAAGDPSPSWSHWRVYLLAFAAQIATDFAVSGLWSRAAYGVPLNEHAREAVLPWLVDGALSPLALSIGLRVAHQPLAILLVLPLVGLLGYFARERRQRLDHAIELSHAYRGTALLLGDVIEADDAYTGSHSRAVVELTLGVCDELDVDAGTRRDAELAALLHDVGKVRIPAAVINKPGPLDDDERALMDTHTIEGERMLEQVGGLLGHVGRIVRSCHEHWDGGGYPDALAGDAIPLAARIVACCDAYHAMTSDRPYRPALPTHLAKDELHRGRGTQFDPRVVDALLRIV